jgi:phosphate transport system substrate-binding protein
MYYISTSINSWGAKMTAARGVRRVLSVGVVLLIVVSGVSAAPLSSFAASRSTASQSQVIHLAGAGSTFDAPFFSAAFARYHKLHPNISISYAAVGSGMGITRFSAGSVNFGASDVPMTAAEQKTVSGGPIVQVPIDLGGVVVSYNLQAGPPSQPLRLSGPVLANIFLGKITNWTDPAITALNPGVEIPNENITVVHRSDSSGTTYIFTNYLSSVSSSWASGPGTNKTIDWPVGQGARGSDGIAAVLKYTPGSIGYFELSYAESKNLPFMDIENQSGAFVPPFSANVSADASMNSGVSSSDFSIVNEAGTTSYPISGYSWILLYVHQPNVATGTALTNLIEWITHAGQSVAAVNFYVSLPTAIQSLATHTLARVQGPGGKPIRT